MPNNEVNESTKIPIRVVVPVVLAVVGAALWIRNDIQAVRDEQAVASVHQEYAARDLSTLKVELQALRDQVTRNVVTRDQLAAWVGRLRLRNPDLEIPEIDSN